MLSEHAIGAGVTDVPRELLRDEPDRNSFYQG
jgi:hypothetical protein